MPCLSVQLHFLILVFKISLKANKNKQEVSFYSIPEFEEWKKHTENYKTWHIKYYKGLFVCFTTYLKQSASKNKQHSSWLYVYCTFARFGYQYKQRSKGIFCWHGETSNYVQVQWHWRWCGHHTGQFIPRLCNIIFIQILTAYYFDTFVNIVCELCSGFQ